MARAKATAGFTLVELMITIAIVAILAIVMMPRTGGFTGRDQARHGLGRMAEFINNARLKAALSGAAHQIVFDPNDGVSGTLRLDRAGNASCCCRGSAMDPFLVVNGGTTSLEAFDIQLEAPELRVSATDPVGLSGADALCFTPDGRMMSPVLSGPHQPMGGDYGLGHAIFEIQQYNLRRVGTTNVPNQAIPAWIYRVVVGYNGLARWEAM
jgi:prepilin-type N-terminal cleavage/methylation domain-containing protein